MSTSAEPFASALRLESEARGEARGEARAILRFLECRGVAVSDAARVRVTSCTDLVELDAWADRATVITSIDELFEER